MSGDIKFITMRCRIKGMDVDEGNSRKSRSSAYICITNALLDVLFDTYTAASIFNAICLKVDAVWIIPCLLRGPSIT